MTIVFYMLDCLEEIRLTLWLYHDMILYIQHTVHTDEEVPAAQLAQHLQAVHPSPSQMIFYISSRIAHVSDSINSVVECVLMPRCDRKKSALPLLSCLGFH